MVVSREGTTMLNEIRVPDKVRSDVSNRAMQDDWPPLGLVDMVSAHRGHLVATSLPICWLPWNQPRRPARS
jgi:hypothetical protein